MLLIELTCTRQRKMFGQLDFSFTIDDEEKYSIIRGFENVEFNHEPILNEFDCPLLEMTDRFIAIKTSAILFVAFIVHECTSTCKLTKDIIKRTVEREDNQITIGLALTHDKTNKLYSANIYCMHQ